MLKLQLGCNFSTNKKYATRATCLGVNQSSTAILIATPTDGKVISASTFNIGMNKLQLGCNFSTDKYAARVTCLGGNPKSPTIHTILFLSISVQDNWIRQHIYCLALALAPSATLFCPGNATFHRHHSLHTKDSTHWGHASLPNQSMTNNKWISTESLTATGKSTRAITSNLLN